MGVACSSDKTRVQNAFLIPALTKVWTQKVLFGEAIGRPLRVSRDGRADSPGLSTKYNTYSLLDIQLNKVLHIETPVLKKKLTAAAELKKFQEMAPWIHAVVNHLYWCALSSRAQPGLILAKSLVHHVVDNHVHEILCRSILALFPMHSFRITSAPKTESHHPKQGFAQTFLDYPRAHRHLLLNAFTAPSLSLLRKIPILGIPAW